MPYGLSNSPSVFQDYINEVLRKFLQRFVIVYIDDIIVYSQSSTITISISNWRSVYSVHFLGYVIDQHGIQVDQMNQLLSRNYTSWDLQTSTKGLSTTTACSAHLSPLYSKAGPSGTHLP